MFPDRDPWAYPVFAGPGSLVHSVPQPIELPATGPHCAGCGYRQSFHGVDGTCPGLKTKRFEEPGPIDRATWREIMRRDRAAANRVEPVHVPVAALPPQVRPREPQHAGEIAGWQGKQAVGFGRKAIAAGWAVEPWYWRAGTGAEGCAVCISKDAARAVATWSRGPGMVGKTSGWATDVAYGWRIDVGRFPMKLTLTELEGLL